MALSYDASLECLREGRFLDLVRGHARDERRALSYRHRALVAHALATVGELADAERLIEAEIDSSSDLVARSQAESARAMVAWRSGNLSSALRHAQVAVHLAQESKDAERLAWAQLHFLRILIESGGTDKVLAVLPEARRVVARAGIAQAAAYLHSCVCVLEGQIGHLDEARRHCDITDSLLAVAPNLWIQGTSLVNRGCIACLSCDFEKATGWLQAATKVAKESGHEYLRLAAETTLGHVQLMTGRFADAESTLKKVLSDKRVAVAWKLGATDGLARLYLATGRLDECELALRTIQKQVEVNDHTSGVYHVRWSTITRVRLNNRLGRFDEALQLLRDSEDHYRRLSDAPLVAAVHLTAAETFTRREASQDAATSILRAAERGITGIRELQAQFYYGAALAISDPSLLRRELALRAMRVWRSQGVVSVHSEMATAECHPELANTIPGQIAPDDRIEWIVNALAATIDVAYDPRLLADELTAVIGALDCSSETKVVETRERANLPRVSDSSHSLYLGVTRGRELTLICAAPQNAAKAILLSDILGLGRAAVALEKARQEERNRAAIWPAPPVEEQAGALFLADESKNLLSIARRAAATTVPVLITGETGTGKEVLARVIHAYSTRAGATFLPFNCSGVPRDMLDSQLFGHRRGAFTGAIDSFPGVIRSAAGGTLFLDEIGETTLDVQPKLLRFLEASEVHPIGEAHPTRVDVRVIAATNADLDALVAQGRFREDLFYRLNIVRLHVPPLRERRVEIPALANHYLQKHAREYRKGDLRLAEETMEYLVLYRWPGNVRQLANEMRRMAALAEAGAVLMPEHLSPEIAASRRTIPASERTLDPTELVVRIDQPMAAATQHLERTMIQYALQQCGGRMEDTAALLGLSRKGLYLKRVRYGLEPPEASAAEVA